VTKLSKQRILGWVFFLASFITAMAWLWLHPNQRTASRLYQNLMASMTAALQESIIFAHMRYHANAVVGQPELDLIVVQGEGLDYNQQGFPVGIGHSQDSVELPINTGDCRDIWNTLVFQLRPLLEPAENAVLSVKSLYGECVFTSIKYNNQRIVYNPASGIVKLAITN
jgi:hypothetical protein